MSRTINDAKTHRPKNIRIQKDANLKRHKLLNQKYSISKDVISEINIMCMHCTCLCVIIITRLIIDVSQHMLNVECGDYAIKKI